jgi:biotin-(acetyl-CoA carboxylase) ligase
MTMGQQISYLEPGGVKSLGTTNGLASGGNLRVTLESGQEKIIHAGDVHLEKSWLNQ